MQRDQAAGNHLHTVVEALGNKLDTALSQLQDLTARSAAPNSCNAPDLQAQVAALEHLSQAQTQKIQELEARLDAAVPADKFSELSHALVNLSLHVDHIEDKQCDLEIAINQLSGAPAEGMISGDITAAQFQKLALEVQDIRDVQLPDAQQKWEAANTALAGATHQESQTLAATRATVEHLRKRMRWIEQLEG